MRVVFLHPFSAQYAKLPRTIQKKVDRQLRHLTTDMRHPALYARKMVGQEDIWEARVDIHYRLTFQIA